jgi:hypothetical protein
MVPRRHAARRSSPEVRLVSPGPGRGADTVATHRSSRPAAVLVWAVWAVALACLLWFIARNGRNIPFEEDWLMVAPMTGHEPDLAAWLWSQNSEHRLPLPRLVNLALLRATGDFRATMVFDTLILAAVAAGMIVAARRLRGGRSGPADAFFPLLLLHLGHWDNLLWAWQIQFVLPTVLACVVLLVIVRRTAPPTGLEAAAAALALACLPLAGANGLVLTPAFAGWLLFAARRRPGGRALVAGAAVALLLCGVYFIGYEPSPWNEPSPGLAASAATSAKFVIYGLGPVTEKSWPVFGLAVAAVLLATVIALAAGWRAGGEERLRVAGLAACLVAFGMLAAALGWGRAGRVAVLGRMSPRYVLLAAPTLCAAYFSLLLYGPTRLRRLGPPALAILAALLFPLNTREGLKRRDWFGAGMTSFERDMASGASIQALADRHHEFLLHWDVPLMVTSMRQLRDADFRPFAHLRD